MGELDKLVEERYLSPTQAAAICGVETNALRRWCKDGYMGAKVGNRYIIDRNDLDQFVKSKGNPNFKLQSYQDAMARERRDNRITSSEAQEALDKAANMPQETVEDQTGGIMMGRKIR